MKNIIFIGMAGCGKSVLAEMTAKALDRPWEDSDLVIETEEGMTIPALFEAKGEDYFREKETAVIARLVEKEGIVISVGGGAVLRNGGLIRKNATVIYIERSILNILFTLEPGTRPLLKDPEQLYSLYEERRPIYERLCDMKIGNDTTLEEALKKILEGLK